MWESIFYTGTTVFPVVVKAYLKTIEEQDATYVEEAQKQFLETVAPLLIRQHSLDPSGPWLLSAGGVEGPPAADFVLAKPLGNARAMAGWRISPRSRRGSTASRNCRRMKKRMGKPCVLFFLGEAMPKLVASTAS